MPISTIRTAMPASASRSAATEPPYPVPMTRAGRCAPSATGATAAAAA
ncbi:hypothetical protein [Streptomyces sp. NPDC102360]